MTSPNLEQPILFISDAHLGGFSKQENARIETELIQLIEYCQHHMIKLAILGDLFDYWMEYPNYVPEIGKKLLDRFESFNSGFGPTLYITGNHDNWTRNHLTERGFFLRHNQYEFSLGDKKVMALHGDGLTDPSQKLPRPLMHKILRNDQFLNFFQTVLPPRMGIKAMKYFSRFTRYMDREQENPDKLNQWAERQLKEKNLDLILCGHDHLPRRKQFSFGTYINLGTFYKHQTMGFYNNKSISLVCWEAETKSLIPFESDN